MLWRNMVYGYRYVSYVIPVFALWIVSIASVVKAAELEHIQQLQQTNSCVNCDLSDADLRQFNLRNSNLSEANLRNANLSGVDVTGANFSNANLSGVDVTGANFSNANLPLEDLHHATSNGTCDSLYDRFEQANLIALQNQENSLQCLFSEMLDLGKLIGLNLEEIQQTVGIFGVLRSNDLQNRIRTNFQGADLSSADLRNADFRGVNMTSAILDGADLTQTNLSYALLLETSLSDVNHGNLSNAFLSEEDVRIFLVELSRLSQQEFLSRANRARESEAQMDVPRLAREQQIFYLENNEWATSIEQLREESPYYNYNYSIAPIESASESQSVFINAQAKIENIRSYAGIVSSEGDYITFTVCETIWPSTTAPNMSLSGEDELCPIGSRLFKLERVETRRSAGIVDQEYMWNFFWLQKNHHRDHGVFDYKDIYQQDSSLVNFSLESITTPDGIALITQAKVENLRSYTAALIFSSENSYISIICETEQPSTIAPDLSSFSFTDQDNLCPTGSQLLRFSR